MKPDIQAQRSVAAFTATHTVPARPEWEGGPR
jgi:hypothetical protein